MYIAWVVTGHCLAKMRVKEVARSGDRAEYVGYDRNFSRAKAAVQERTLAPAPDYGKAKSLNGVKPENNEIRPSIVNRPSRTLPVGMAIRVCCRQNQIRQTAIARLFALLKKL
jgi:hypothetical protein